MTLQPATQSPSAAKIGIFSKAGAGKSLTSTLLAIGASVELHNRAAVAYVDTEDATEFVRPVFEAEGVPLLVSKSRSFVDMRQTLTDAEHAGCCALIVDSYSHPWAELNEAFKAKMNLANRRLQYQHREELWRVWSEWTRAMRASPLHVILAGRLSFEYLDDEDDAGDPQLIKVGTKMRGESDAGYEPNLLIELEAIQDKAKRDRKTRSKQGTIVHHAYVLKDRKMILNGLHFSWKDLNAYTQGDYQGVWRAFAPHFGASATITQSLRPDVVRTSAELFAPVSGESRFAEDARRRTIACEELQATLTILWPTQTAEDKRLKVILLESLFQTRSWTAIEHKDPLTLEAGLQVLQSFESTITPEHLRNESEVVALIQFCKDELREKATAF